MYCDFTQSELTAITNALNEHMARGWDESAATALVRALLYAGQARVAAAHAAITRLAKQAPEVPQ